MPTVSAIEPGKRRGRFNIYVDGQFTVAVGEKVMADLAIRIGQSFSQSRLTELVEAEEVRRAIESAVRLIGIRPRSIIEIDRRLQQKSYERTVIDRALEVLRRYAVLDDEQFADQWVESRTRSRPKGARLVQAELLQKGVARETIDQATRALAEDELETARRALAMKVRKTAPSEDPDELQAEYRRLMSFLQRRGFGWDAVKTVLAERFRSDRDDYPAEDRNPEP